MIPLFKSISLINNSRRKSVVRYVRDYLKNALGDTEYFDLKELFFHVCVDQYDYKVLTTTRVYLLYQIFLEIFVCLPEELDAFQQDFQPFGKVYNNHSLVLLKDVFLPESNQDKRLLLVDDIIITGRSITETFNQLMSMGIQKENIYIWCDLLNMNANCLSSGAKERLETYRETTEIGWKTVSNIFSQAIIFFGRGNTSCTDTYLSYDLNSDGNKKILFFLREYDEKIVKLENLKENGIETYIYYLTQSENSIIGQYEDISCLRFYVYNDSILIIPCLFIDSVKKEEAYNYGMSLLSKYQINKVPSIFEKAMQNQNYDLAILFLQWVVNQIGKKIVCDFCNMKVQEQIRLYVVEHPETFNFTENETFSIIGVSNEYSRVGNRYSCADIEFCKKLFKRNFEENGCCRLEAVKITEYLPLLQTAFNGYVFAMNAENQRRTACQKAELPGIRISDVKEIIYTVLNASEMQKERLLILLISFMIAGWDNYFTSYNFTLISTTDNDKFISAFWQNGEQAYRAIYDFYSTIYSYYYIFTLKTLEIRIPQLLTFGTYLANKLFPAKIPLQDIQRFTEYLKLDTSYFENVFAIYPKNMKADIVVDVDLYIESCYKNEKV